MKSNFEYENDEIVSMKELHNQLVQIRNIIIKAEKKYKIAFEQCHPKYLQNLYNLIHYISLRQIDLRQIQHNLANWGLSSLGRSEGHVLSNVNQVIERIEEHLSLKKSSKVKIQKSFKASSCSEMNWSESQKLLHSHTQALLGNKPQTRHIYIIVTAPGSEEVTPQWTEKMLRAGMNCLRINCAHGNQSEWHQILNTLRRVSIKMKIPCKVMFDLAGPKIRTGPIEARNATQVWKPSKNEMGVVSSPLKIEILSASQFRKSNGPKNEILVLPQRIINEIELGDRLAFRDGRGKKRELRIDSTSQISYLGSLSAKVYLKTGTEIHHWRGDKKIANFRIKKIFPHEAVTLLRENDLFYLVNPKAAKLQKSSLPEIPCTLAKILRDLRKGERVYFDDGKLLTVVEKEGRHRVLLRVIQTQGAVFKLKPDKGINFPDSKIQVAGLTAEDKKNLKFVEEHADILSLSFIKSSEDVREILKYIPKGRSRPGLVLKIETVAAFSQLPQILIDSMKHYPVGVMIARGDLAVECGFERLAELQEEILWLCEAAGVPAIWATQVLESLAHSGVPSRAEISDAAMSVRAEAVMLNKGPYIDEAVKTLDDILQRMEKHQYKKRQLYRSLKVAFSP